MISELTLNSNKYLINEGLYGICYGLSNSNVAKIVLPSDVSTEGFPLKNVVESGGINRTLIDSTSFTLLIQFPNGLVGSGYNEVEFDFYVGDTKIDLSNSLQSNVYYLPKGYAGYFFVDTVSSPHRLILIGDYRFDNSLFTVANTSGYQPTSPVALNYWPNFLVSTHSIVSHDTEIASWAGQQFDCIFSLSTNFTFDTTKVEYYPVSIYGYRGGNRFFNFNDCYIYANDPDVSANECMVSVFLTNMSASARTINSNFTVSILWARHIINGVIE